MGVVYEARHRELNRRAAIKMLRGEALADPEYRERFRAEAEAIARLQHPNVIQVFEVGTAAEPGDRLPGPFLALEFVDGGSLAQHTYSPQPPAHAARTVETLARAVHAAHALGVVHRDLKPANVLLTRDGTPKIADFGIAKRIDAELDAAGRGLTRDGTVMGTPEYMAPEQLHGQTAHPAVDIYALGVILYELLTGRVPFRGATFADTMLLTTYQEPVPPRHLQPAVPRDLETICLKCLEKDPARRYATAADLADDLTAFREGRPIRARPLGAAGRAARWARRNPAVAALSALVLAVGLAGVSGVVWKWAEAQANADQARENEAEAKRNADRAEEAADEAHRNAGKERYERYRMSVFAASSALRLHDSVSARQALDAAPPVHRDWVWHQLRAQLDRSSEVIAAGGRIEDFAVTPDGRRVLLASRPRDDVRVWDLTTRTEFRPPERLARGHHVDLSPDGNTVAHMPDPKEVRLYAVHPWRLLGVIREPAAIRTPTFSADGTRFVTVADDGHLREWDVATGAPRRAVRLSEPAGGMRLSPDLRYVVTAHPGRSPVLCDTHTGRELARLDGHVNPRAFFFSPAGDRLLSAEEYPSNTLRLWAVPSGRLLATLNGHENYINDARFSPDGKALVTGGYDRTVRVWDLSRVDGGAATARWVGKAHTNWISQVTFSPDGRRVVSASADRTLRYWDAATGEVRAVLQGHEGWALVGVYTDGGKTILSVSGDGTMRVWPVTDLESDYALRGHTNFVYGVSFSPDGRRVASAAWDGTARVWDADARAEVLRLDHAGPTDLSQIVTSVAYHRSGGRLATLCRDDLVRLWDAETGKELHRWPTAANCWADSRLAFSPTADLLAAGGRDGRTRLWDAASRRGVGVLDSNTGVALRDVAFSPDGARLAVSGELSDLVIRVWDVASQKPTRALTGHTGTVYALAWNKAGTLLASGSLDDTVRLWDATTLEPVGEPLKQGANVFAVAFSPDSNLLAVGCADNLIRVWNVETRQILAELSGHKNYVHALAFSPDGTRLVSGSGDHTLRVWDTVPQKDRRR
jgi:WD40 repeat protein/tRNA A-37 threonylcarbamoyl transferase component Bud32